MTTADWELYCKIGTSEDYYAGRPYLGLHADPNPAVPVDPDAPPVLPKLLSATWRHALVEDGSWPAIQGPSTGSVSIVFATAAEVADLRAGAPITLRLWLDAATDTAPVSVFSGRISNPELTPHRLGVVATFTLSDHLATLAEDTVGEEDYPAAQQHWTRLAAMFAEAGRPMPVMPIDDDLAYTGLAARPPEPVSLLDLAQETVAAVLIAPTAGADRLLYELRPNLHPSLGDLDPADPYLLTPLPREAEESEATLAAGQLLAGGKWTRSLFSDTNTVHVVRGDKVVARVNNRLPGEPPVTLRRSSPAISGAAAADLAAYLLPDPAWVPGWEAETFTIPLEKLPAGSWPGQLRDVLTVTDIPVQHNPHGTDQWTGVVTAVETSIASPAPGKPRVQIGLTLADRPRVAPPPPPPPGRDDVLASHAPTLWYKFNETTGTVAADSGSAGHAATYRNGPVLTGSYVDLDGVNDDVLVPYHAAFNRVSNATPSLNRPLTITTRVRVPVGCPTSVLWGRANGSSSVMYLHVVDGVLLFSTKFTTESVSGTTDLRDGAWHDVAVVLWRVGTSYTLGVQLVIDGVVDFEGTIGDPNDDPAAMAIGSRGTDARFPGDIGDWALFSAQLTLAQLAEQSADLTP